MLGKGFKIYFNVENLNVFNQRILYHVYDTWKKG